MSLVPLVVGAGVMTLVVLVVVLRPLLRGAGEVAEAAPDLVVYRDQLAELDRDIARGLLAPAEADGARLEIQRRILAIRPGRMVAVQPAPRLAATIAVAMIGLSAALYVSLGAPLPPDERAIADPEIGVLEARLAARPDDPETLLLLARAYSGEGRFPAAIAAYERVLRLAPDHPDLLTAYGETLTAAEDGIVTPAARAAFDHALRAEPDNPTALWMLGLAARQEGDAETARLLWRRLLGTLPAGSPPYQALVAAIEGLGK